MKIKHRALALILSAIMVLTFMPSMAFAAAGDSGGTKGGDCQHVYDPDDDVFITVPTTRRDGLVQKTCSICGETTTVSVDRLDPDEAGYGLVPLPDESQIREIELDQSIDVTDLGDGQIHTFRYDHGDGDLCIQAGLQFSSISHEYGYDCEFAAFTDTKKIITFNAVGNSMINFSNLNEGTVYFQFDFKKSEFENNYIPADTRVKFTVRVADYSLGEIPDDPEEIVEGETKTITNAKKGEVFTYAFRPQEEKGYTISIESSEDTDQLLGNYFRNGYEISFVVAYDYKGSEYAWLKDGLTYYIQVVRDKDSCTEDTANITVTLDRYKNPPLAEIDPDCPEIELYKDVLVEVEEVEKVNTLKFIPEHDGTYTFTSTKITGSVDPYGAVCLIDEQLKNNDDSSGRNFKVTFDATAGTTYYLQSKSVDGSSGSYTVRVREVHNHVMTAHPRVEPTCQADGHTAYYTCEVCGLWFSNSSGTSETTPEKTVLKQDPDAHVWDEGTVITPATFEAPGEKLYVCTLCDQTRTEEIPKIAVEPVSVSFESVKPLVGVVGERWIYGNSYYMDGNRITVTYNNGSVESYVCKTRGDYVGYFGVDGASGELVPDYTIPGGTIVLGENTVTLKVTRKGKTVTTPLTVTGYATSSEAEASIHVHSMLHHEAKAPGCTSNGIEEYWECSGCEKFFSDANGETEIAQYSWVIPAAHDPVAHAAKAATCTESGNSAYWSCSRCDKFFSDADCKNVIAENSWETGAAGHNWAGEVDYSWSDDHTTVTATAECDRDCHTGPNPVTETVSASGEITKPATLTEKGEIVYTSEAFTTDGFEVQTATVELEKKSIAKALEETQAEIAAAQTEADTANEKAETSTNEADVEEALTTAQSASDLAEQVEAAAVSNYDDAKAAWDRLTEDSSDEDVAAARAELESAAANVAAAKQIKASAKSIVAKSNRAAAKVASNKAAAASEAASNAPTSDQAEQYRKEAEEQATRASTLAGKAEEASGEAAQAVSDLNTIASELSGAYAEALPDNFVANTVEAAASEAENSADEASSAASAANTSSDKAKESAGTAKTAVETKKNAENAAASAKQAEADLAKTKAGTVVNANGATVAVLTNVSGSASGTVAYTKAPNRKTVVVPEAVVINGKTFLVTEIGSKAFTGKKIKTVTIGKNVKTIRKNAFKKSNATKLIVKTTSLTKASVKGSLKGSKVKTVQVKVGAKSQNKKFAKKYKKIFTKSVAGKKATVK